jgi:FlaA1/EpsC-like NDP-sugar epimerase
MAILVSTNDGLVRDEPVTQTGAVAVPLANATPRWSRTYARALVVTDFAVIAVALLASTFIGSQPYSLPLFHGDAFVSVWDVVVLIGVVLFAGLSLSGSRSPRVVGVGTQEYRAILYSCFLSFASVALVAYLASLAGLHFILLVGLATTTLGLLLTRWICRRWLVSERRKGRMSDRVLLVGSEASVAQTARDLQRTPAAGLRVVGACTPTGRVADVIPGTEIPVSGSPTSSRRCAEWAPTRFSSRVPTS